MDRKKTLELYSKQVSRDLADASDFVPDDVPFNKALDARDLAEDALANEVLKNTGVPIPAKNAKTSQVEDFLSRIISERYPELKDPSVNLQDLSEYDNAKGIYVPSTKQMSVNQNLKKDPISSVSGALHEAAHKYDDEILNFKAKDLRDAPARKTYTPDEIYERMAKGHHAEIPNLREGSFGKGALKSMLKNGTFKGIAPFGIGAALTAAALPEEASASDFIPGLDQADNAGSAMDDKLMQTEVKALRNYDKSNARRDALSKLKKGY